jgi:hypothetical protein
MSLFSRRSTRRPGVATRISALRISFTNQVISRPRQHVPAVLEVTDIGANVGSTNDTLDTEARVGKQSLGGVTDLGGELTSGAEDEDGGEPNRGRGGVQKALNGRNEEGEGLAGTGLGLGKDVVLLDDRRKRRGLDLRVSCCLALVS